ncbi:MAG: hypothetical protein FWF80_03745, partial [Defluviitaleaceae bacterium]|nr:hypothetical protein [Defluviitaleaceae bacterium]
MKSKKAVLGKVLAVLIAIAMMATSFPLAAFADAGDVGTADVTISPDTAFIAPGESEQFEYTLADGLVYGEYRVDWSINGDDLAPGTTISNDGVLTVCESQEPGAPITVTVGVMVPAAPAAGDDADNDSDVDAPADSDDDPDVDPDVDPDYGDDSADAPVDDNGYDDGAYENDADETDIGGDDTGEYDVNGNGTNGYDVNGNGTGTDEYDVNEDGAYVLGAYLDDAYDVYVNGYDVYDNGVSDDATYGDDALDADADYPYVAVEWVEIASASATVYVIVGIVPTTEGTLASLITVDYDELGVARPAWLSDALTIGGNLPRINNFGPGAAEGRLLRARAGADGDHISWVDRNGNPALRLGGITSVNHGAWFNLGQIPAGAQMVVSGWMTAGGEVRINHGGGGTAGNASQTIPAVGGAFSLTVSDSWIASAWTHANVDATPHTGVRLELNTAAMNADAVVYIYDITINADGAQQTTLQASRLAHMAINRLEPTNDLTVGEVLAAANDATATHVTASWVDTPVATPATDTVAGSIVGTMRVETNPAVDFPVNIVIPMLAAAGGDHCPVHDPVWELDVSRTVEGGLLANAHLADAPNRRPVGNPASD